jgi:hypothetical protein
MVCCLLTYFRTNRRDLEEILQEEPKTAEELLKTAMDIITDLEKFANKKLKKIKKILTQIFDLKEGDIMGGFAKRYDTRKNMLALVDYV